MLNDDPGSPAALFDALYAELKARQSYIGSRDDYIKGDHPLPRVLPGMAAEAIRLQEMCRTNWTRLVVQSGSDNLRVIGLRRGDGSSGVDAGLAAWSRYWQSNNLDKGQRQVWWRALGCAWSFVSVWPSDDEGAAPVISVESPRNMIVVYEPGSTTERLAALKCFEQAGWVYQCMWTQTQIFRRKTKSALFGRTGYASQLWTPSNMLSSMWEPWFDPMDDPALDPMEDGLDNPFGVVPVVEFAANVNDEGVPTSDIDCILPIQDRINHTTLNRVFVWENQSYPQRVFTSEKLKKDEHGQTVNPLKAGPDRVSLVPDNAAKTLEWAAADVTGALAIVRADVADLTATSRTAPNVTIAELANIGADAMRSLKESQNERIYGHQDNFADSMEETLRLAMLMDGDPAASDTSLELIWKDPAEASLSEKADAVSKVGPYVPRTVIWQIMGMSPQQQAEAAIEEASQQQADALFAAVNTPPPAAEPVAPVPPAEPAAPVEAA